MSMKEYLIDLAKRVVKTAAETALGVIGASAVTIGDIDFKFMLGAVTLSAVSTVLINLANIPTKEDQR